jgi:pyroglutamyl-peptidase
MKTVLITAFEPYDRWKTNSSWLTLVQLTHDLPREPVVTTRLYPVDFAEVKRRLAEDLKANYDFALHLGQAPGSGRVQLESIAVNIGGSSSQSPDQYRPLADDGPVAYRSTLPLGEWSVMLRRNGLPAQISHHAGTYLCNATLYLSCYYAERLAVRTQSAFVHLPLDVSQTASLREDLASMPVSLSAAGLRLILGELVRGDFA